jgi:hypothetical protein
MDPGKRLRRGEQAAREQRYEEALADYIWFHEHALEHDRAQRGVRLSFALASWRELGDAYPPALDALRTIRDRKARALLEGAADRSAFNDVASIDYYLGAEVATYQLFLDLHRRFPELARNCASLAMPALIQNEDFKLARTFIDDPEESIRHWSSGLNEDIADLATEPPTRAPVREGFMRIYAEQVSEVIQVLSGVGEVEEAERLRNVALASIEAPDVRETVVDLLAAPRSEQ